MDDSQGQTYDYLCYLHLASEFDPSEKKETEEEIKMRLKQFKLGDYNQDQVDYIRQLKNELVSEINFTGKSKYFHKVKSRYGELEDYDVEKMVMDYSKEFDKIETGDLRNMINLTIYLYYLK